MMLKKSDIVGTKLVFNDGAHDVTVETSVRYIDDAECFLALTDRNFFGNFHKNMNCCLYLCTENGVYEISAKLSNTSFSLQETVLEFKLSKKDTWKFIERRRGKRKMISLPMRVKFYTGKELSLQITKLSESGCLCHVTESIDSSLKQFPCDVVIDFSKYPELGLDGNCMQLKAKLTRMYGDPETVAISFKFTMIFPLQINAIRTLLNKI